MRWLVFLHSKPENPFKPQKPTNPRNKQQKPFFTANDFSLIRMDSLWVYVHVEWSYWLPWGSDKTWASLKLQGVSFDKRQKLGFSHMLGDSLCWGWGRCRRVSRRAACWAGFWRSLWAKASLKGKRSWWWLRRFCCIESSPPDHSDHTAWRLGLLWCCARASTRRSYRASKASFHGTWEISLVNQAMTDSLNASWVLNI